MIRRVLRSVRWYVRELTGEAGYDHYLAWHQRAHPDAPVLGRAQFERIRVDRRAADPGSRCC